MTIYKYGLEDEVCTVQMPEGAKVLSAHAQNGSVCIWALVDPSKPIVLRTFKVIGTGWKIEEPEFGSPMTQLEFIGTVLLESGRLVFHVFEEKHGRSSQGNDS